jgi:hypothetical protein
MKVETPLLVPVLAALLRLRDGNLLRASRTYMRALNEALARHGAASTTI